VSRDARCRAGFFINLVPGLISFVLDLIEGERPRSMVDELWWARERRQLASGISPNFRLAGTHGVVRINLVPGLISFVLDLIEGERPDPWWTSYGGQGRGGSSHPGFLPILGFVPFAAL
jgi:hypothetical protein